MAARHFAGRAGALTALTGLAAEAGGADGASRAMVIAVIEGTAGIGKTALAVHFAHQVAGDFPDGQLYVNLRGFDPAGPPMTPGEAIRIFLDALGVRAGAAPGEPGRSGGAVPQPAGGAADAGAAGQRPRRGAGAAAAARPAPGAWCW